MRNLILSAFLMVCAVVVIVSCDDETQEAPKADISSVTPEQVVEGDTLIIAIGDYNGNIYESMKIGDQSVIPFFIGESEIKVVVPYFSVEGMKSIEINFSNDSQTLPDAIEFLPLEFLGVAEEDLITYENDTILLRMNNMPRTEGNFQLSGEQFINGSSVGSANAFQYFQILDVTDEGLKLLVRDAVQSDDIVTFVFYLGYHEKKFAIEELIYLGKYKIEVSSYKSVPGNELLLFQHIDHRFSNLTESGFTSHVYLNGIKLKQFYHDPIWEDGYYSIEAFEIPTNLSAGSYELAVFELDGVTPVLSDSSNIITVSDIAYCAEKDTYSVTEEPKINIYPYLYPYRCYSCPDSLIVRNVGPGGPEFKRKVETVGANYPESSYFIFKLPADAPPGFYEIEITTDDGVYMYKQKEGCANNTITLTP